MENFDNYLQIAREAARLAGDLLMKDYGQSYELIQREPDHYSIKKDKEANNFYESFLCGKTPGISLYTEEGVRLLDNDLVWVVDPLDGSYNYRIGLPLFVTQLCLLSKREPAVAVIYNPVSGQEFFAVKGGGSFLNGKRIFVSEEQEIKKAMFLASRRTIKMDTEGKIAKLSGMVRAVRIFGATGFDLSYIAAGKAEFTINDKSKLFDYAPGVLLVREAGGLAKNIKGEEWTIEDDNLVAGNKCLTPKILEIIKQ